MGDAAAMLLTLVIFCGLVGLLILCTRPGKYDRLWCKGEHDWVDEGWFSKCSRCPADFNHYDRPGGAGWG